MPMLRVRTVFTGVTGSPWMNTLNFGSSTQSGSQTAADAAVAHTGAFWGAVDALINTAVTWTTLPEVLLVGDDGVATASFATTPATGQGAGAAEIMPFATQALVRTLTGFFVGGRQLRGRIFIPGLTEASNASGQVIAATQTALQNAANTLNAAVDPPLAVWSKTHATVEPVSSATVWSQFAVLRSRRD